MSTFDVQIDGRLEAKNLDSASKKLAALEERLKRAGIQAAHVHLKGAKA